MDDKVRIKKKIIRQLDEIPESKLNSVYNYIESLGEKEKNKMEILSFAGSWAQMDSELFDELRERRTKNSRRRRF